MTLIPNISNLPGQIDAALQFLCFTEEIVTPTNYGGGPAAGRNLTKTEFEVKDSALTVLLEYFNQPLPTAEPKRNHISCILTQQIKPAPNLNLI